ncbi:LRR receptor-like serine/threonine-protein kinase ERECTA [Arachis hypogaea]|uniref:LRR receptor-like serine/threonine-protein kinase ERECTA n=1 Tax=Arachis hypogaea TaxID=3818 RepID=A0A6B9V7X4_ARAHY|nr:LRR receptor-like serine/threonine-protein kinase ERECTA [Arachis hypogaea]
MFKKDPNLFISLWFILMNGFRFLLRGISNNNIIGSIPSSLGDLEHLLKLNLSRNHITGFIPAEFANLRSVMDIDLSNLIPQELSQLQNMVSLFSIWDKSSMDIKYASRLIFFL